MGPMIEETDQTPTAPTSSDGAELAAIFRVSPARWDAMGPIHGGRAAAVVIGAWALLAWSRFGFQATSAPRAPVRFVLVGVYGWLGLAVLLWAAGRIIGRIAEATTGVAPSPGATLDSVVRVVGLAHQPILVVAVLAQFLQVLPLPRLSLAVAVFTFVLWLPGVLGAAVMSLHRLTPSRAALVVIVGYGPWLATAGRYLNERLGHLI